MGCCGSTPTDNSISPTVKVDRADSLSISSVSTDNDGKNRRRRNDKNNNRDDRLKPVKNKRITTARPKDVKELEVGHVTDLPGHSQNVDLLAWSFGGDILISAGTDRKTFLWNRKRKKGSEGKQLDLDSSTDAVSCINWSETGAFVAAGTEHGGVVLWRDDGSRAASWRPHQTPTKAVKISSDGDFILSAADIVCIYARKSKTWLRTAWSDAAFTDAEWINEDQFISADLKGVITMDTMKQSHFTDLSYAFDLPLDVPEHQYKGHTAGIYKVLRHPGRDDMFASCSVDCSVIVWTVDSRKPLHVLSGHFGYVTDLVWIGMRSELLASASYDGSVKVWNTRKGELVHSLDQHRDRVTQISVTNDGEYLGSSGHDGCVNFWKVDSGKLINAYEGPGRMLRVDFNREGSKCAVASYGIVQILDLKYTTKI